MLGGVARLLGARSLTFGAALFGEEALVVGGELFEFGGFELVCRRRLGPAGAEEGLEPLDERVVLVDEVRQDAFGRSG